MRIHSSCLTLERLVSRATMALLCATLSGCFVVTGAIAQTLPKYELTGFRDARFGMSEQEVRAVAMKTFGIKPADIAVTTNPVEGTAVLSIKAVSLDPGPGPVRIAYIFGHTSKKLIQVNVIWGEDAPQTVDAVVTAGTRLQRYFAEFAWKKDAAHAGIPVGDNTVVLFAGDDEKKGSIRLVVDGVKYQMQREGNQPATSPDPKGPPRLILNYISDRDKPDIARIEKGKF